jgi:hypothetical protein
MRVARTTSVQDIALVLGVSEPLIRKWARLRKFPCPHDALKGRMWFNEAEVKHWMDVHGVTGKTGRPRQKDSPKIENARLRKENALARRYEIMADKEDGLLVPRQEVDEEWGRIAVRIRTAFENLASEIIPVLLQNGLPQGAAPDVQQIISEKIAGVLRVLSSADEEDEEDGDIKQEVYPRVVSEGAADAEPVGDEETGIECGGE